MLLTDKSFDAGMSGDGLKISQKRNFKPRRSVATSKNPQIKRLESMNPCVSFKENLWTQCMHESNLKPKLSTVSLIWTRSREVIFNAMSFTLLATTAAIRLAFTDVLS